MDYHRTALFTGALITRNTVVGLLAMLAAADSCAAAATSTPLEQVTVWGKPQDSSSAAYTNPTSVLLPQDMQAINAATTEDLVKYEPSLVIRRRYIGDANGTLGIRGSNMFQTSRSMVFADGVPLHYLLQSRWNGSPRWTLVSASEIAQVEVIYGPFSAEYSGNAMGGVVNIETAIPQKREFHVDGSFFAQDFSAYDFDGTVNGFKGFASVGDKLGDFSYYLSYNHLDNDSQPQSYRYATGVATAAADNASGALARPDQYGHRQWFYGDTGVEAVTTDNYKIKLGYDFGDWQALLNLAYEDRQSDIDAANSYVSDLDGHTLWSGTVVQGGEAFSLSPSSFGVSALERQSLSTGLRLKGQLSDSLRLETTLNQFAILRDNTRTSARNPDDPAYTREGQVADYHDSGWQSAEVKLIADDLGIEGLQWINGIRAESYELNLDVYNSSDYRSGDKDSYRSRFGGKTQLLGVYSQANWSIDPRWSMALGLRYEHFKSHDGYFNEDDIQTPELDLTQVPSTSSAKVSPKFSLGYIPASTWQLRYSVARAYRFPIVEELFSQYQAYNTLALANPGLKPEAGLHHNVMIEKTLEGGYLRVNLFQETIKDAIEAQSTLLSGGSSLRTFIPIDEVDTQGIEFVVNQSGWLIPALDVRFNLAWTEAEIVKNAADPSLEGNSFPRMPTWRSNLLATWHASSRWDLSGSIQYASDSYGSLANDDDQDQVFGAQDAYTRLGVKASWQWSRQIQLGIGVDNLTNEIDYVAHPWPGRTGYLTFAYDL